MDDPYSKLFDKDYLRGGGGDAEPPKAPALAVGVRVRCRPDPSCRFHFQSIQEHTGDFWCVYHWLGHVHGESGRLGVVIGLEPTSGEHGWQVTFDAGFRAPIGNFTGSLFSADELEVLG